MKTIAVLALAAAALVSCQQQNQGTEVNTTVDTPTVEVSKK